MPRERFMIKGMGSEEASIVKDTRIAPTERDALIQARRGQGKFRLSVMEVERACRVTKVDKPEHLIASHTKPWRDSSNDERLDGENGFLLTLTVDHLFDKGFISFENSGDLIVSPVADPKSPGEDGDQAGGEGECRRVLGGAEEVSGFPSGECVEDVEEAVGLITLASRFRTPWVGNSVDSNPVEFDGVRI